MGQQQQQSCNIAVVFVLLVLAVAVFFLIQRCRSLERRYEQVHIELQSTVSQEFLKTTLNHLQRPAPEQPSIDPFEPGAFSCTDIGHGDAGVASAVLLVGVPDACTGPQCRAPQWEPTSPKVVDVTDAPADDDALDKDNSLDDPFITQAATTPTTLTQSEDWVATVDPDQLAEIQAGLDELAGTTPPELPPHPGFQATFLAAQEAERAAQAAQEAELAAALEPDAALLAEAALLSDEAALVSDEAEEVPDEAALPDEDLADGEAFPEGSQSPGAGTSQSVRRRSSRRTTT